MEDPRLIVLVYLAILFAHCFAKQNFKCDLKTITWKILFVSSYEKLDFNVVLSIAWKFCSKAKVQLY